MKHSSGSPIRLVLDTNIYLAASSTNSFMSQFVFATQGSMNAYALYTSPIILQEVESKLIDKFHYTKPKAVAYIKALLEESELIYPTQSVKVVARDPDDDRILECALEAKADMLITADKDLLSLKSFEGVAIVHPSQLKYIFADIFS